MSTVALEQPGKWNIPILTDFLNQVEKLPLLGDVVGWAREKLNAMSKVMLYLAGFSGALALSQHTGLTKWIESKVPADWTGTKGIMSAAGYSGGKSIDLWKWIDQQSTSGWFDKNAKTYFDTSKDYFTPKPEAAPEAAK